MSPGPQRGPASIARIEAQVKAINGALAMLYVTGIEEKVCTDIVRRQQTGIAKYGTTVQDNPLSLREWVQHAYEECLDQAVYLRKIIQELDSKEHNDGGSRSEPLEENAAVSTDGALHADADSGNGGVKQERGV